MVTCRDPGPIRPEQRMERRGRRRVEEEKRGSMEGDMALRAWGC